MKYGRVKDLISAYIDYGMVGVARYLSDEDMVIERGSWIEKMKKLLDSKNWISMEAEIATVSFKFNLIDENGSKNIRRDKPGEGSEDRRDTSNNN